MGQSSDSAALRSIIEEYAQIKGLPITNNSQSTPPSSNPAD
jgi:hypothetical protein